MASFGTNLLERFKATMILHCVGDCIGFVERINF